MLRSLLTRLMADGPCYLRIDARRLSGARPTLVIHPEIELAGGLSDIETRALEEPGAVRVHYGRKLTDLEVREMA